MPIAIILYFTLSLCALVALSIMIHRIGTALADCPATGRAAKAGALTIVAGFAAIGSGGVLLIAAAALVLIPVGTLPALMAALGLSVLCLGLGFTQAVAALRDVVARAAA